MNKLLSRLASLRLTSVLLGVLAAGLVAFSKGWLPADRAIGTPLVLLAANLGAALVADRRLRRHPGLYAFHVCLLIVAVLAAWGRLAGFSGRIVLAEGQVFRPELVRTLERGLLAGALPAEGAFLQGPVSVAYAPGLVRGMTHSQVRLHDERDVVFGDDVPLIVDGLRFYTTSNKGFAILVEWTQAGTSPVVGTVNLPSYPLKEWSQSIDWVTPAGTKLRFGLDLPPVAPGGPWRLSRETAAGRAVTIQEHGITHELLEGDSLDLPDGRIRVVAIGMWQGYKVVANPALPWLFSAAAVGGGGLLWFLLGRVGNRRAYPRATETAGVS